MTIILLISGFIIGVVIFKLYDGFKLRNFHRIASEIINKAELEAEKIIDKAKLEISRKELNQELEFEKKCQSERQKLQKEESRLKTREDKLEERLSYFQKKLSQIEKNETALNLQTTALEDEKKHILETKEKLQKKLEKIGSLTAKEAKDLLINEITNDVKREAENLIRKTIKETEENAGSKANEIIITSINRLAKTTVSENTIKTVTLPSEDMKGRIIGKEGRNIRTLEKLTGVNFLIDDTPGAVVLSGFDPLRLQLAKNALTELITDGRIHPSRIEEAVEKAGNKLEKQIKEWGKDAAFQSGNMDLHAELINLLGKLKFRYSYGQNVLDHSIEVSTIMGLMAHELDLNAHLAKRIGLLHDIGKAVSFEVEGSHVTVGCELAKKYGESMEVVNGIACHHRDEEPATVEAKLLIPADTISATRPGARVEAIDEYVKRLKKLEDIAYEFPGIDKAYAFAAGREIQVFVLPDMIDDAGTINLARDITKKIEKELKFPGKIKVSVIREKKIVDYAL